MRGPSRQRLAAGFLAGLGWFGSSLLPLASFSLPGYVALVALEAGLLAVGMLAVPPRSRLLGVPAALVLVEAVRSAWPFGGLPLAGPALGQVGGPLAPAASIGGGLLLVGLMALLGTAAAVLLDGWRTRRAMAAVAVSAAVVAVAAGAWLPPAGARPDTTVTAAAVQGGGPRGIPGIRADTSSVLDRHLTASQQVREPVDLVLWPEGVIDLPGPVAGSPVDAELAALARRLGSTVVAGVTEQVGADRFRNAAVAWDAAGRRVARYDKAHRVPFGEYAPARALVERLADLSLLPRDAIPGRGPGVLDIPPGRVGVLISYEVFFGRYARAAVGSGGTVLLVPTNAASYTTSQIPAQELAAARLRALETGRAVIQAAPTGLSALVEPTGRVAAVSELGAPAVLQQQVPLLTGETVYVKVGDAPVLAAAMLMLVLAWAAARGATRAGQAPDEVLLIGPPRDRHPVALSVLASVWSRRDRTHRRTPGRRG